jgi:HK97 gp10 family phage protein
MARGEHIGAYSRATHITGLTHAIKKFKKIAGTFDGKGFKQLEQALLEGAELVRDTARSKIHSRSGGLARSIVAKVFQHKKRDAPAAFVAIDYSKTEAFYAHMVEYGTVKMSARPFMRHGIDENRWNVIAKVRNRMSKLVHEAALG